MRGLVGGFHVNDHEICIIEGAKADDRRVAQLFASHGVQIHKMTLDEWTQWQKLFQQVSFTKFRNEVPDGARLLDQSVALYK